MSSLPVNRAPLAAFAIDGEVVLASQGPGVPVAAAFTPEAVLASLEVMRAAAELAIWQRTQGPPLSDDPETDEL
jgi:hypothetical protein